MPGLPHNDKQVKWAPQQDILAHPKIKLFMTHCGLLSIQEAVYHGVPVLGLPIFGDQNVNANLAAQLGFGEEIEILDVTEDGLEASINNVVKNDRYKRRVQQLSELFRDNSKSPLDEAVYWTEYVMRYKGATHLRSAARQLNFFQYHCLDVAAFLVGVTLLGLWLFKICLVSLARKLCGKNTADSAKKKRN
jgi:glucuronosyltransferase